MMTHTVERNKAGKGDKERRGMASWFAILNTLVRDT